MVYSNPVCYAHFNVGRHTPPPTFTQAYNLTPVGPLENYLSNSYVKYLKHSLCGRYLPRVAIVKSYAFCC